MTQPMTALPDLSKYHLRTYFNPVGFPMHLISPVEQSDAKGVLRAVDSLFELINLVGVNIEDKDVKFALKQHQERYNKYKFRYGALSFAGYLLIGVPCLLSFFIALSLAHIEYNTFTFLPMLLLLYMVYQISKRLVSVWFDRRYADTLSFVTCLYLLSILARENALVDTKHRKQLLARMRSLRTYLGLLPYQFAVSESSNSWAHGQFRRMAEFIEERHDQIIAPLNNSQINLFTELRAFLEILLSGKYGEFKHTSSAETAASLPVTPSTGVLRGILRFLGTITPVFLLLWMFFFPEALRFLGVENKVISYISLAWLFLAIDANLKLGIVQGVASLAKAMKELS
jgi:hypothetical protein